MIDYT